MNIVTKTALANFRRNKSRNVLVGIAVLLTTILLSAVPMVLFGGFVIENEAIKDLSDLSCNVPECGRRNSGKNGKG